MVSPKNTACMDWSGSKSSGDVYAAILREKRIKKWRRAWKIELIEKMNPDWTDLFEQIV